MDAIAAIALRLEGIPLAIELAAARLDELGPQTLLERLQPGLDVLRGKGPRSRKRTLRGAIDWSWNQLTAAERSALFQATVFRGGFDLAAAQAVIQPAEDAPAGPPLAKVLAGLCDRSLLRATRASGGPRRHALFDSIRAYVVEHHESHVAIAAARARHADWMVQTARQQASLTPTHDGPDAHAWLLRERDNLLAVHERALRRSPTTATALNQALEVAAALYPAMIEPGPQSVLAGLFERALAALDAAPAEVVGAVDQPLLARALALFAEMRGNAGQAGAGLELADRALALAEAVDSDPGRALASYARGVCLRMSDRMDDAVAAITAARTLAQAGGDLALECQTLNLTGGVFYNLGERETAEGCFRAALGAARQVGYHLMVARATGNLGCVYADRGDCEGAWRYFHESLVDAREQGNRRGEGVIHSMLGLVAQERGNVGLARLHFRRGLDLLEEVGDGHRAAYVKGLYAWFLLETDEMDAAAALLEAIVAEFVAKGDWRLRAMFMATLGYIHAVRGDRTGALSALGRAAVLARRQSDPTAEGVLVVFRAGAELAFAAADPAAHDQARRDLLSVQRPHSGVSGPSAARKPLIEMSSEVRTALRIVAGVR